MFYAGRDHPYEKDRIVAVDTHRRLATASWFILRDWLFDLPGLSAYLLDDALLFVYGQRTSGRKT